MNFWKVRIVYYIRYLICVKQQILHNNFSFLVVHLIVKESINIIKYFPALTENALRKEIRNKGILFSFDSGDVLMNFGQIITHIPLVIEGGIRIIRQEESGKEIFLYYLSSGETCAMSLSCCSQRKKSEIKAIAENGTVMLMIPIENMEIWLKQYPSWKNFIFETYQKSYDKLMQSVEALSFQKLDQRLLTYLKEKARISGKISFQMTHQEIADELNSSREAISRLLKKLEQEKKLELGRNYIKLVRG